MDPGVSCRDLGFFDSEDDGVSLSGLDFGDFGDGWRTYGFDNVGGCLRNSDMDVVDGDGLIISELEFANDDDGDGLRVDDVEFADDDGDGLRVDDVEFADDDGMSVAELEFALNYDDSSGGRGASDHVIAMLKNNGRLEGKSLKGNAESRSCPVCLEDLSDRNELILMPCSHLFHETCIIEWLMRQNKCPLCRRVPYEDFPG